LLKRNFGVTVTVHSDIQADIQLETGMRVNFFHRLIGTMTVGRKLALIYFLDLLTVIFISGILIHEKYIAINFAEKEIVGNEYIAIVRDALLQITAPKDASAGKVDRRALITTLQNGEATFGNAMGSKKTSDDFVMALQAEQ
jgi:hypothetical protein